jgi:2C-methyl-D-erythritol 2,4-cyclodiphosphate synthase
MLAPYRSRLVDRLGAVLDAPVSVKAKRPEGLGSLGRAEGIACMAVVLLESRDHGRTGSRAQRE